MKKTASLWTAAVVFGLAAQGWAQQAATAYFRRGLPRQDGRGPVRPDGRRRFAHQSAPQSRATEEGALPTFQVKNTDVVLQPYFSTPSLDIAPQTWFQLPESK